MVVETYRRILPIALVATLGLAACSSAISPRDAGPPDASTPPVSGQITGGAIGGTAAAVPLSSAKFSFAPVTGAPASVLASLSSQLGSEAFAQHVTLVPASDGQATYVVKGYLSAVGDPSGTILVYVWDVFDSTGKRVHRISGQETSSVGSQDPWGAVDPGTIANVARRTIGAIVSWTNGGV